MNIYQKNNVCIIEVNNVNNFLLHFLFLKNNVHFLIENFINALRKIFIKKSKKNDYKKLSMNLQFFANDDAGEKTEAPSDYRKEKAREEGQVAKSVEINTAFLIVGLFFALKITATYMYENFVKVIYENFNLISSPDEIFTVQGMSGWVASSFGSVIMISLPMFAVAVVLGVVANVIQVGWKPTAKALQPKFGRMNPIEGMKRIFSKKAFLELFKSLGKFGLIFMVVYMSISDEIMSMVNLVNIPADQAMMYTGEVIISLGIKVGMFFAILAAIDYFFQRRELMQNLMMSKQEVKEEYKQLEGDPQIKQQRRQKQRQMSMSRMMQDVKTADVIITNPTHFAVAIKYERDGARPPYVVAKGADYMAQRIKDIARENKVEIVENKPLARTLFATVDIGESIPEELYQAVAEVLAFVYKLKGEI